MTTFKKWTTALGTYERLRKYYSEDDLHHYEEGDLITNHRIIQKASNIAGPSDEDWKNTLEGAPIKGEKDVLSMQLKDLVKISISKNFMVVHLLLHYRFPAGEGSSLPEKPDDLVKYYTTPGHKEGESWDFNEEFSLLLSKAEANQVLKAILSVAPNTIVEPWHQR